MIRRFFIFVMIFFFFSRQGLAYEIFSFFGNCTVTERILSIKYPRIRGYYPSRWIWSGYEVDNIWIHIQIFNGYMDTEWIQRAYKISMDTIHKISIVYPIHIHPYPDIIHGYAPPYPKYPMDIFLNIHG